MGGYSLTYTGVGELEIVRFELVSGYSVAKDKISEVIISDVLEPLVEACAAFCV